VNTRLAEAAAHDDREVNALEAHLFDHDAVS
jgi:hypothetical protein